MDSENEKLMALSIESSICSLLRTLPFLVRRTLLKKIIETIRRILDEIEKYLDK